MRRAVGIGLLLLAGFLVPRPAEANILCRWFGYCVYESPGFRFTVADKATGQPLADIHALAEWVQHGPYGRNGPLMVQDALSGADGALVFPAWGPVRGTRRGLMLNLDPTITLFKPGHKTLRIQNAYPEGTTETTRVRRFGQDGQTIAMEPFRGTPETWMEQLRKAKEGAAISLSEEQIVQFRVPYLNQLKRLWAERSNVPLEYQKAGQFFWHVERDIKLLQEGK